MEYDPLGRPMEVLDDDRPPGPFARRLGPLLERRGARPAAGIGLAALLLAGWAVLSPEADPVSGAPERPEPAEASQPTPREPDAHHGARPWRVDGEVQIRSGGEGRLITFYAVNDGEVPQDPRDLQVETSYPGGLASSYAFGCVGGHRTSHGFQRLDRPAAPMERVFVRCPDTVRLNGQPGRLPPEVVDVVNTAE